MSPAEPDDRPKLLVLAGVNGAGKSSLGGLYLERSGMSREDWYNPDTYARELVSVGLTQAEANAEAWAFGRDALVEAIGDRASHAFETTLGGNTIPTLIRKATSTHAVHVWFCGLDSPERHMRRVAERVARGGHDIPEEKIRQRYISSIDRLVQLLPRLASLQVFDNSVDAGADGVVPEPRLVLKMVRGELLYPATPAELEQTPDWAIPVVEAALTQAGA